MTTKSSSDYDLSTFVEPLFVFLCRTNRLLRNGVQLSYEKVRADAIALFERLRESSKQDARLQQQYAKVELPLIFTVDEIMATASAPWSSRWGMDRLATRSDQMNLAQAEHGGSNKFFDLLDECLKDTSAEASEQLLIYYICLGLGFMGQYDDQPMLVKQHLLQISQRLRRNDLVVNTSGLLLPDAYQHTDTSPLETPVSNYMTYVTSAFVALSVVVLVLYIYFFRVDSHELYSILQQISSA